MKSNEIRRKFLDFFKNKGHTIVQSDFLIPKDDPTLMFTGAGMNQFKEQFMGRNITYKRAASCQKCLRTGDLENVGKTPRHHTFFEMLGNFSFGDYFKKEAVLWAWEFMTEEIALPKEKLWVSVYKDDKECYSIWRDEVKVPSEKIIKLGPADNFWPQNAPTQGPNGPCGPCSEIFYDWGEKTGCGKKTCGPSCDCGRFVELWNLVFTEFDRKPDGMLEPLPNKNIDTGMGLERMASVLQGVMTNFETDLFKPIIDEIVKEFKKSGDIVSSEDVCLMADHIRAATFAIADGVSPSNEKRGYVIRKLIRRSYLRSPRKGPFLYNIVPKVVSLMKDTYPELEDRREHISAIVREEEKRFSDTLDTALPVLNDMISGGKKELSGSEIFRLVDTYGLPVDVILQEAGKEKISLDIDGFEKHMKQRREESRKGSDISCEFIFRPDRFLKAPNPRYSGELPLEADIEFIVKEDEVSEEICEGECAEIITSPQSSSFYPEAGGQAGDTGSITKKGALMNIMNTFDFDGRRVFGVMAVKGSFKKNDKVVIRLDLDKKQRTAKNHTATHLLQAALRGVLGNHVKQSGSYVDDKRLRFDFTHMKKLSEREIVKIEDMVNTWIEESISVSKETKALNEAKKEGALSFFGEKYEDTVRVVTIGNKSKELCGGTHVSNTHDIGVIKIISESSVASGIRRIEALTGENAGGWIKKKLESFFDEFKSKDYDVKGYIAPEVYAYAEKIIDGRIDINKNVVHDFSKEILPAFLESRTHFERKQKKRQKEREADVLNDAIKKADEIAAHPLTFGKIKAFLAVLENLEMPLLRKVVAYLEKKADVVVLGSSKGEKAYVIGASSDAAADVSEIIRAIAKDIDGKGGGKPTFAQAGGKNPAGLWAALKRAEKLLQEAERRG